MQYIIAWIPDNLTMNKIPWESNMEDTRKTLHCLYQW